MGKTYIDTVKYIVYASLEIDGIVEKPDVVGAIFGQTEGLLGEELDLRELQKSGRIGRIEVNLQTQTGKSAGEIILPSSLARVETAILAAALETVDRVGPCEAKIKVLRLEDTRSQKRTQVVDRAKSIIKDLMGDIIPESKVISEEVRDEVKVSELTPYGKEQLAAGPNIKEADELIVVEGRADVITLLKCDIDNVIAMSGKDIPPTVVELAKEKTITAFVDGDRGGDLIVKALSEVAEIEFVAKAPDGKEVEELTKKEVIKCLRHRMPLVEFLGRAFPNGDRGFTDERRPAYAERPYQERRQFSEPRQFPERREPSAAPYPERREVSDRPAAPYPEQPRLERREERPYSERRPERRPFRGERRGRGFGGERHSGFHHEGNGFRGRREDFPPAPREFEPRPVVSDQGIKLREMLPTLEGSFKAVLLDEQGKTVIETDVRSLSVEMEKAEKVHAVVFDGIVTQRLVDIASNRGVKYLVGVKQAKIDNRNNVEIVTQA